MLNAVMAVVVVVAALFLVVRGECTTADMILRNSRRHLRSTAHPCASGSYSYRGTP
jgi:hypothetical protein